MPYWRPSLVLLSLLVLSLPLVSPAGDLAETSYDESEAMPYQGAPLFSNLMPQTISAAPHAVPRAMQPALRSRFGVAESCSGDSAPARAETRGLKVFACPLLC